MFGQTESTSESASTTIRFYDAEKEGKVLVPAVRVPAEYRAGLTALPGVVTSNGFLLLPKDIRLVEAVAHVSRGLTFDPRVTQWMMQTYEQDGRAKLVQELGAPLSRYPETLARRLFPFQVAAVRFFNATASGGLLADETGLGKSVTSIATIMESKHRDRVLILCPNSLKRWWEAEIARWTSPSESAVVMEAKNKVTAVGEYLTGTSRWLIMNLELLKSVREAIGCFYWDWIVVDEAHRLKNRKTQTWQLVTRLEATKRLLVTGTPVSNEPADLWALLHVLEPERYPSYWRFYELYTNYKVGYTGYKERVGVKNAAMLRKELEHVMLRRYKKDHLLDLPPKMYKSVPVQMSGEQQRMYKEMAKGMVAEIGDRQLEATTVITQILRLRQILSSPVGLGGDDVGNKVRAVMELIEDATGPVVVFTMFRGTISALEVELKKRKIPSVSIIGGIGSEGIANRVEQFQHDTRIRAALCTYGSGGVGITLHRSDNLVLVERHYNPSIQLQAEDRVHRVGQHGSVIITSLHCPETVDTLVSRIADSKLRMSAAILQQELIKHLEEVTSR